MCARTWDILAPASYVLKLLMSGEPNKGDSFNILSLEIRSFEPPIIKLGLCT